MTEAVADVVVVGGGVAGGAVAAVLARNGFAVTLLERQARHEDLVRGEFLVPWGIAEMLRMGLADCLYDGGAWSLRWWRLWDETVAPGEALAIDMTVNSVSSVEGPVTVSHPGLCRSLTDVAALAGAEVVFGARDVRVEAGPGGASVSYRAGVGGAPRRVGCRLVIGAGGRYGRVGRQAGIGMLSEDHGCWGAGLAVEGLGGWPDDTQAMGTEKDVMFFVFPQGGGRARLYLNYGRAAVSRFTGPHGTRNLLDAFRLACVPGSELVARARPAGRLASYPLASSLAVRPVTDGVVLIGDEAGMTNSILGTGLANAMRDARIVSEVICGTRRWSADAFAAYATERDERLKRIRLCARIMSELYMEFTEAGRQRRRRAMQLMATNPAYALFLLVAEGGPEKLPDLRFASYLAERLRLSDAVTTDEWSR